MRCRQIRLIISLLVLLSNYEAGVLAAGMMVVMMVAFPRCVNLLTLGEELDHLNTILGTDLVRVLQVGQQDLGVAVQLLDTLCLEFSVSVLCSGT